MLHLEGRVEKRDRELKHIHARNLRNEVVGMGCPYPLCFVGVRLAPGTVSKGKLPALRAGGENLRTEANFGRCEGHFGRLSSEYEDQKKRPAGAGLRCLLLFYRLDEDCRPSFDQRLRFEMKKLRESASTGIDTNDESVNTTKSDPPVSNTDTIAWLRESPIRSLRARTPQSAGDTVNDQRGSRHQLRTQSLATRHSSVRSLRSDAL